LAATYRGNDLRQQRKKKINPKRIASYWGCILAKEVPGMKTQKSKACFHTQHSVAKYAFAGS